MCNYIIEEKTQKKNLWGGIGNKSLYEDLKDVVSKERGNEIRIVIDLKGIKTIDVSFIQEVFIDIHNSIPKKKTIFIFKNIENDSIKYYLSKSFLNSNLRFEISTE